MIYNKNENDIKFLKFKFSMLYYYYNEELKKVRD